MIQHGELSPRAQERAESPRNYGPLQKYHGHATTTGSCGDTMEFWIRLMGNRVAGVGFTTTGCASSRAAGSMATELVRGRPLPAAARITETDILAALGGLPPESEHCALLAARTLKAAIRDASAL